MEKEKLEKKIDHIIREYTPTKATQEICRMIRQLQLNAYKEGSKKWFNLYNDSHPDEVDRILSKKNWHGKGN